MFHTLSRRPEHTTDASESKATLVLLSTLNDEDGMECGWWSAFWQINTNRWRHLRPSSSYPFERGRAPVFSSAIPPAVLTRFFY